MGCLDRCPDRTVVVAMDCGCRRAGPLQGTSSLQPDGKSFFDTPELSLEASSSTIWRYSQVQVNGYQAVITQVAGGIGTDSVGEVVATKASDQDLAHLA